jgi:hypothetical protein
MKNAPKILFSILTAAICTVAFAADKPICKKNRQKLSNASQQGMQLRVA